MTALDLHPTLTFIAISDVSRWASICNPKAVATMRVGDQLAFALQLRSLAAAAVADRGRELAALLEIQHLLQRLPAGLSGGEAQRVALGRALAARPSVLCLDEPLSALDEALHDEMCELLRDVRQKTGVTILHVTHSRREAAALADSGWLIEEGGLRAFQPSAPSHAHE